MQSFIINNIIVLIPAYKPGETLYNFVCELSANFKYVILVDDGSGDEYDSLFDRCLSINENISLYRNVVNMGKGRAIKNGINYAFNKFRCEIDSKDITGFATVDADGQHSVSDICNCCNVFRNNTDKLVIGSRNFGKDVPFRSKFGNIITSFIMKAFYGISLKDTQSGLRVFSIDNAKLFSSLRGERYEYEILMIIESIRHKTIILEENIETIYIDNNSTSHFNPLIDSYKIYKVIIGEFLKFSFSSLFSFFIDIYFFSFFVSIFKSISGYYVIISSVAARVISSFVNFILNKNIVFHNKESIRETILKYYALAIGVLIVSSSSTYILAKGFSGKEIPIKICVDLTIFFIDYRIQRLLFKNKT